MKSLELFGADYKSRVNQAIEYMRDGKGVLLIDDENRENEGDIIYAAEKMNVQNMAQMIRECSGIVCLCLEADKCKSLGLRQMADINSSKNQTAFTVSIEAKEGVTTGVSASDRINTIRTAIANGAKPSDLAHPGHVFPLEAKTGGVFARRGHTEGSVDLAKLAGLGGAAVLCELTNEDGSMARTPEIIDFAKRSKMTVVTIEDIVMYRKELEGVN